MNISLRLRPLDLLAKSGEMRFITGAGGVGDVRKIMRLPEVLYVNGRVAEGLIPSSNSDIRIHVNTGFHYPYIMSAEGVQPVPMQDYEDNRFSPKFLVRVGNETLKLNTVWVDGPWSLKPPLESADVVVLRTLSSMITNGDYDLAIDMLFEVRRRLGPSVPVYAPGIAPPLIPVLYGLGVDLFDDIYSHINHTSDPCALLLSKGGDVLSLLKAVEGGGMAGNLPGIMETCASGDMDANVLLRKVYERYSKVEHWFPIYRNIGQRVPFISPLSLNRTDIVRWRRRIMERYIPPTNPVAVLLPCSSRKPYSESRTHRTIKDQYRKVVESLGLGLREFYSKVHEYIVTSPLGVVPRELERVYPAAQYDTPVAGLWSRDEVYFVGEMLYMVLSKGNYSRVIVHPKVVGVVRQAMAVPIEAGNRRVESVLNEGGIEVIYAEDEKEFRRALVDALETEGRGGEDGGGGGGGMFERVRGILSYQFRADMGEAIKGCDIRGRALGLEVWHKGKRLMSYARERGVFALSIDGWNHLLSAVPDVVAGYEVGIGEGFDIHGSVLAPGILNAGDDIRVGDEVYITRKGEVCGSGVALMCGIDMALSNYGVGVKVREHI